MKLSVLLTLASCQLDISPIPIGIKYNGETYWVKEDSSFYDREFEAVDENGQVFLGREYIPVLFLLVRSNALDKNSPDELYYEIAKLYCQSFRKEFQEPKDGSKGVSYFEGEGTIYGRCVQPNPIDQ